MAGPYSLITDTPGGAAPLALAYAGMDQQNYWNAVNARRADQQMAQSWALQEADAVNKNAALAWNRYDRNNPDPVTRQQMGLSAAANQRAQDSMALDILRTSRALSEPTAQQAQAAATETQFLWKDALDQADQGLFGNFFDVAKAYPKFSPPEQHALLRQSLRARQTLQAKDAESAGVSQLLSGQLAAQNIDKEAVDKAVKVIIENPFSFPTIHRNWIGGGVIGQNDVQKEVAARKLLALPPTDPNYVETLQKLKELAPDLKLEQGRDYKSQLDAQVTNLQKLKPAVLEGLTRFDPGTSSFVPTQRYAPQALGPVQTQAPAGSVLTQTKVLIKLPSGQLVRVSPSALPAALAGGAVVAQ